MVEHKLGVCVMKFAGDPREGNSEEADSIVARRFPKHRKDPWGRHCPSSCQSHCSTVQFRQVWAVSYFYLP